MCRWNGIKMPLPLTANSHCLGFKRNVTYLVIWCQNHQMAFIQFMPTASYTIPKPTNAEGKLLPSLFNTSPQRVSLIHFSSWLSPSPYTRSNLSSTLLLIILHSRFSMESISHRKAGLQNTVLKKWTDCQMLKDTPPQAWAVKHICYMHLSADTLVGCVDAQDYDLKSTKCRL